MEHLQKFIQKHTFFLIIRIFILLMLKLIPCNDVQKTQI